VRIAGTRNCRNAFTATAVIPCGNCRLSHLADPAATALLHTRARFCTGTMLASLVRMKDRYNLSRSFCLCSRRAFQLITLQVVFAMSFSLQGRAGDQEPPRTDLGVQAVAVALDSIGEKPLGLGGRLGFPVSQYLVLDGEFDYFPENPSGNFGESLALVGVRVPLPFAGRVFTVRARPGFIHFGGRFFRDRNPPATFPAIDLGGGLEIPAFGCLGVRVEAGDLIVLFHGARINGGFGPTQVRKTHNSIYQLGLFVRF
jgi:hypothetical protein